MKKQVSKRNYRLSFRLTKEEFLSLEKEFKGSHFAKKSQLIRAKIFLKKISKSHENRHKAFLVAGKMSDQINRIANNFNQLVHATHSYKQVNLSQNELKTIQELAAKIEEILQVLRKGI